MEQFIKTTHSLDTKYLAGAIDYDTYKTLVTGLLSENRVTGAVQSEALVAYTRLNVFRMHRIEKTLQVLPEVKEILESITSPQTWLVLTEGWCGDAAQTLPVIHALSALNNHIKLYFLLRDENLEIMDQYLTNGSRSIPKLIVYNSLTNQQLFDWGPRPAELQKLFIAMKQEGMPYDAIKEEVHRWYARDHTFSTQKEISSLLSGINAIQL